MGWISTWYQRLVDYACSQVSLFNHGYHRQGLRIFKQLRFAGGPFPSRRNSTFTAQEEGRKKDDDKRAET